MHEYSIVSSLLDLCAEEAQKHAKGNIIKIVIEVGERSGVELALLRSAFETIKIESDVCKNSVLEILTKQVVLHCGHCDRDFAALGLKYGICPHCNSTDVIIAEGRELNLLSIEME